MNLNMAGRSVSHFDKLSQGSANSIPKRQEKNAGNKTAKNKPIKNKLGLQSCIVEKESNLDFDSARK